MKDIYSECPKKKFHIELILFAELIFGMGGLITYLIIISMAISR